MPKKMHISMFSGIGGPELAAEWCGWENISHTEWNPFGRHILNFYWPGADSHEDATKTDYTIYRGRADVLSAGFPCQGFSLAGKRLGTDDDRYHWPTVRRAYNECRPGVIVLENVTGLLSMEDKSGVCRDVFAKVEGSKVIRTLECDYYEKVYTRQATMLIGTICENLEKDGYRPQPFVIPAGATGAPHKRERVFIVAYANGNGSYGTENRQSLEKRNVGYPAGQVESCKFTRYPLQITRPFAYTYSIADAYKPRKRRKLCNAIRYSTPQKYGWQQQPNGVAGFSYENAANSGEVGLQRQRRAKQEFASANKYFFTHTPGIRQPRKKYGVKKSRQLTRPRAGNDWANFPTQSPICGRDDGVSSGLDFDTVFEGFKKALTPSKWRNESIKAFGNAIVPQVIYQIFKTIDEVDVALNASK